MRKLVQVPIFGRVVTVPARPEGTIKTVPAPHVKGPGRQVIRVPSVISQAVGTRDREAIYGTKHSQPGRSNGPGGNRRDVAKRRAVLPTLAKLAQEARLSLDKSAKGRYNKGRGRYETTCRCLGACQCPKTVQHGLMGPKDLLALLEKVTGKPCK